MELEHPNTLSHSKSNLNRGQTHRTQKTRIPLCHSTELAKPEIFRRRNCTMGKAKLRCNRQHHHRHTLLHLLGLQAVKHCNRRTSMFTMFTMFTRWPTQPSPSQRTFGSSGTQGTNQDVQLNKTRERTTPTSSQLEIESQRRSTWATTPYRSCGTTYVPGNQWTSNPVLNFQNHGGILYLLWIDILPSQIVFIFANLNFHFSVL